MEHEFDWTIVIRAVSLVVFSSFPHLHFHVDQSKPRMHHSYRESTQAIMNFICYDASCERDGDFRGRGTSVEEPLQKSSFPSLEAKKTMKKMNMRPKEG